MDMVDLSVEFAGVTFRNPFLIASSTLSTTLVKLPLPLHLKKLKQLEKAGAGGIITKLITNAPTPPDWGHTHYARLVVRNEGLFASGGTRLPLKLGAQLVKDAKKGLCIPVIANFIGDSADEKSWVENALALQEAGADMLEMDLNSPMMIREPRALIRFQIPGISMHPDLLGNVVKALKETIDIPVIGKIPPTCYPTWMVDVLSIAKVCEENKADAITVGNAMRGMAGIDIKREGRPLMKGFESQGFEAAYCGLGLNPVMMALTARVAKNVNLPISSSGGIVDWESAVTRMMLGATTVQLCSALYVSGLAVVSQCVSGMKTYLEQYGYDSPSDIIGIALKYIVDRREDIVAKDVKAVIVNKEKCYGCPAPCIETTNSECLALSVVDGFPTVDEEKCTGCSLCYWSCPHGAIRMEER